MRSQLALTFLALCVSSTSFANPTSTLGIDTGTPPMKSGNYVCHDDQNKEITLTIDFARDIIRWVDRSNPSIAKYPYYEFKTQTVDSLPGKVYSFLGRNEVRYSVNVVGETQEGKLQVIMGDAEHPSKDHGFINTHSWHGSYFFKVDNHAHGGPVTCKTFQDK